MRVNRIAFMSLAMVASAAQATIYSISNGTNLVGNRATNLLVNGSFEANWGFAPNHSFWGTGTTSGPTVNLAGWTASGGPNNYALWGNDGSPAAGIRGSAALPHGQAGLYFGAGVVFANNPPTFAANGEASFPGGNPGITPAPGYGPVYVEQTVTGLNTSQTYLLDFWVSSEGAGAGVPGWLDGVFGLDITGEATTYLAAPAGNSVFGNFQRYKVYFSPNSSTATFRFTNWGHFNNPSFASELCMDDVILNPVPEPATWLALSGGLITMLRRRKK